MYFWLCGPYNVCCSSSVLQEQPQTIWQESKGGCVTMKLGLWTLKFKFHIVFSGHEIFWFFSQPLKNIKPTLSSGGGGGGGRTVQKQVLGQIWPVGKPSFAHPCLYILSCKVSRKRQAFPHCIISASQTKVCFLASCQSCLFPTFQALCHPCPPMHFLLLSSPDPLSSSRWWAPPCRSSVTTRMKTSSSS